MPSVKTTKAEFIEIYSRQVDTVYRVCYSFMKNKSDTEDLVQETFLKLLSTKKEFENERHERAWLIVTASNLCKDALKSWWRKTEDIDTHAHSLSTPPFETNHILEVILDLPANQRIAVYMHYYEGFSAEDIAASLKCPASTIRSRLARARKTLRQKLGGDF